MWPVDCLCRRCIGITVDGCSGTIQRCYQDQGVRDQDQTKTRQAETETKTKTRQAETETETKTSRVETKTKTSRVETKTKTKTSKSGLDRSRDQDQVSRYVRNVVV